jgi:hypothetical protein
MTEGVPDATWGNAAGKVNQKSRKSAENLAYPRWMS